MTRSFSIQHDRDRPHIFGRQLTRNMNAGSAVIADNAGNCKRLEPCSLAELHPRSGLKVLSGHILGARDPGLKPLAIICSRFAAKSAPPPNQSLFTNHSHLRRPPDLSLSKVYACSSQAAHLSLLTSHFSLLTSHLSPLTSHLSRLTTHIVALRSGLRTLLYARGTGRR